MILSFLHFPLDCIQSLRKLPAITAFCGGQPTSTTSSQFAKWIHLFSLSPPPWYLYSRGYFPINSNYFWKTNPADLLTTEHKCIYFTVSSWCWDVKITKLRYQHHMQVNVRVYMFLSVTYGQPPEDSCAPASLPSPSEIPPRWFSSFSHPPHNCEQKFNKATRLGHIKVETSMYYFAFPSFTFPQDQDHSNHPH